MSSSRIRVISERIMSRGLEPAVARLMENVKTKVRAQPGILSVETFRQLGDDHKYVVFSEVRTCSLLRVAYCVWIAHDGDTVAL